MESFSEPCWVYNWPRPLSLAWWRAWKCLPRKAPPLFCLCSIDHGVRVHGRRIEETPDDSNMGSAAADSQHRGRSECCRDTVTKVPRFMTKPEERHQQGRHRCECWRTAHPKGRMPCGSKPSSENPALDQNSLGWRQPDENVIHTA